MRHDGPLKGRIHVEAFYHPFSKRHGTVPDGPLLSRILQLTAVSEIPLREGHSLEERLQDFHGQFFSITATKATAIDLP